MPYYTGAQGPQSAAGAQGPTMQGPQGNQAPWGLQGPTTDKRPPFSVNGESLNLSGTLFLMLSYTHANGKKFAIFVERAVPENADLLAVLPDDIVQMANLIDFRPQHGVFRTLAGGTLNYYVVELTGSDLIDKIKALSNVNDTKTSPRYVASEVGL